MSAVISDNALTILKQRYLVNDESVEDMFHRVAGGNQDYYDLMADLRFLPNSPTLFNAGLNNGCTLSACFVFDVDDTMLDSPRSIVHTRAKAIAVAKAGGGVGYWFGNIRPKGSPIKSVHRVACGPVAVLRDYHAVRQLITQGGKRDLAQMGILPCYHDDVEEFIHCKDEDPQGLSSFNISVSWTDDWVRRAFDGEAKVKSLWDQQVESAWKTGCPGMSFWNRLLDSNPNVHLGHINATNPCGETPNRSDEPCNLGSLNLRKYVTSNREVNYESIYDDACLATRFLDDILDRNVFPHQDITAAALLTRKLGLGVMGWADMLALLHIHYDTKEAINIADRVMKTISAGAWSASQMMAKEKGPYKGYDPEKTNGPCSRNETCTSIAPTGTIALIADCSSSIEPHFDLEWERTTFEGIKMKERISCWEELDGFVPRTAREISPEWHVRHQAAFQKHTDLGVSKTVNLPNSTTKKDVSNIYRMMFETGCKGGTIYRDGCRSEQVLVSKGKTSVFTTGIKDNGRQHLPNDRNSITHKFKINGVAGYLTVGLFDDGTPAEIFLRFSKLGSTVGGMLDSWAISFSIALQNGTPLESLCRHHKGTMFEPRGMTGNPDLPICTSIPDYVVRWLEQRFLNKKVSSKNSSSDSGMFCPDCGSPALYSAGCLSCSNKTCGWNRCG